MPSSTATPSSTASTESTSSPQNKENIEKFEDNENIKVRIIKGVKNVAESVVYEGPKEEATGCQTIPGLKPILLNSAEEVSRFMTESISDRCFVKKESIVMLGNDHEDVEWIVDEQDPGKQR